MWTASPQMLPIQPFQTLLAVLAEFDIDVSGEYSVQFELGERFKVRIAGMVGSMVMMLGLYIILEPKHWLLFDHSSNQIILNLLLNGITNIIVPYFFLQIKISITLFYLDPTSTAVANLRKGRNFKNGRQTLKMEGRDDVCSNIFDSLPESAKILWGDSRYLLIIHSTLCGLEVCSVLNMIDLLNSIRWSVSKNE